MKFSDMMNKRDRSTSEVTEPELPPEAATAPPVPEAPIRFGERRTAFEDATAAVGGGTVTPPPPPVSPLVSTPPAPPELAPETVTPPPPLVAEPPQSLQPTISEVVAELAPRPPVAAVTDQQLDASAWLDDIPSIDDDLLPR